MEFPIAVTPFKILLSLFVIFAWSRAFIRFREKILGLGELALWTILWAGALAIIFIPAKTDFVAELLGVGRGADAIFTLSIIVLFYTIYRLYAQLHALRRDLTKLVQGLARKDTEQQ